MSVWWSVGLAGVALVMSWMLGNRQRSAFLLGVAAQLVWCVYAVASTQWGFLASAVTFAVMNFRNWRKWKQLDDEVERERTCSCVTASTRVG